MSGGGETIRISLGPTASAVTSHLCNLEGLACTSPSSYPEDDISSGQQNNNAPLCDPNVTHGVSGGVHVPRVLFVDGMDAFDANPWQIAPRQQAQQPQRQLTREHQQLPDGDNLAISGAFESFNLPSTNEPSPKSVRQWGDAAGVDVDPRLPPSHHAATLSASSASAVITSTTVPTWSGQVDVHQNTATAGFAAQQNDPLAMFHQTAMSMANASQSRYRATNGSSTYSSRFVYPPSSAQGGGAERRHMQWDSDEEEEVEEGYGDEEENEELRRIRERRDSERWYGQERDMHDNLVGAWGESYSAHSNVGRQAVQEGGGGEAGGPQPSAPVDDIATPDAESGPDLAWIDYFMPPHPSLSSYAAPLPFNTTILASGLDTVNNGGELQQAHQNGYLSSYFAGYNPSSSSTTLGSGSSLSASWRADVLSEKIRKMLEDCDTVKGFNVAVEGGASLHGGLATSLLEELHDECRSAGRFCYSVDSHGEESQRTKLKAGEFGRGGFVGGADSMGESKMIESFRSALNSGLSFHGLSSNSDIFLPISLPKCGEALVDDGQGSVFRSSAAAALAIEASTLPYRLLGTYSSGAGSTMLPRKSKIGIQSGYFIGSAQSSNSSDSYATAERLSFHEYISCLKPSNRHTILELDALIRPREGNDTSLNNALLQGTSIERKRLEAEANMLRGRHRYGGPPREVEPGLWLEDHGNYGGTLSPFSPLSSSGPSCIRSNHTHFALSTTYRPSGSDPSSDPVAAYTTPLMEGMGIRYRPEVSLGSVVRQSISGLTGNAGYAAGAYWSSVLSNTEQSSNPDSSYLNTPVLSVLGNSTRIYPHLNTTSTNLAAALSRKYGGYMARDTMAGLAPEGEDCTEATEACHELRDAYEPPLGSGLAEDEEGEYFSENED